MAGKTYIATDRIKKNSRSGHAPESEITKTAALVKGLGMRVTQPTVDCEISLGSNYTGESGKPAGKLIRGSREPLDMVHRDLCGPMGIVSVGKDKYFVTLYDETSADMLAVRFIYTKDQAGWDLKEIITELQSVFSNRRNVRQIRMDNGGEFIVRDFQDWFTESGIMYRYSPPYSTESNGRAERLNRTLLGKQVQ